MWEWRAHKASTSTSASGIRKCEASPSLLCPCRTRGFRQVPWPLLATIRSRAQSIFPAPLSGLGAGTWEGGEGHFQGEDEYAWEGDTLRAAGHCQTWHRLHRLL